MIILKTRKLIHERSGSRYKSGCQRRSLKILNSFTNLIIAMQWQNHEDSTGKKMVYCEFTEKELNRTKLQRTWTRSRHCPSRSRGRNRVDMSRLERTGNILESILIGQNYNTGITQPIRIALFTYWGIMWVSRSIKLRILFISDYLSAKRSYECHLQYR